MKKILLTRQEEVAVRATRRIWVKILKELKAGKQGDEILEGDCALCELEDISVPCNSCPYYRTMGYECDCYDYEKDKLKGHYRKWAYDPTLRTCKSIISLLDKMLENSKVLREKKK